MLYVGFYSLLIVNIIIFMEQKIFIRKCPSCQKELYYNNYYYCERAKKRNGDCNECRFKKFKEIRFGVRNIRHKQKS